MCNIVNVDPELKTGVFIGRFQPFHRGHLSAIKHILTQVDFLIVIIGSAQLSHQENNPFTAGERLQMIKAGLDEEKIDCKKYLMVPVNDSPAHHLWVAQVNAMVPKYDVAYSNDPLTLRLFLEAGVKTREVPLLSRDIYSATMVRRKIVEESNWEELVQKSVAKVIRNIGGVERIRALSNPQSFRQQT